MKCKQCDAAENRVDGYCSATCKEIGRLDAERVELKTTLMEAASWWVGVGRYLVPSKEAVMPSKEPPWVTKAKELK